MNLEGTTGARTSRPPERDRPGRCAAQRAALQNGFTLIELMVVIVIIAILATLAIPQFKKFRDTAKETETAASLRTIQGALAAWGADNNSLYPFRVRYYDAGRTSLPGFNPANYSKFPPLTASDPGIPWFSMGLFGGDPVVNADLSDNTQTTTQNRDEGVNKHTVIQPSPVDVSGQQVVLNPSLGTVSGNMDYQNWYRYFNQYTDPLVAGAYIGTYPTNPFLKRPMGSIMYGNGHTDIHGKDLGYHDHTIPYEGVVTSPGDFVYTFYYHEEPGTTNVVAPEEVVQAKKSYAAPPASQQQVLTGTFYVDLIDSYQLWAFGMLPVNSGMYIAYPNNSAGVSAGRFTEAKKDWDNSGSKDMFESGVVGYFKVTTSASGARTNTGAPQEF